MNSIVFMIAFSVIIFGLVKMIDELTGIGKRHKLAMERIHMRFIKDLQDLNKTMSAYSVPGHEPSTVTYLVPCWPGVLNKLRGKIKLCLWTHEYSISKPDIDKSYQFLVVSKSALFYMQLKGWIETTERKKAARAISYLGEMVSMP